MTAVTTSHRDGIAVITSDNPPVNALGAAVRAGLLAALREAAADSSIKGIVLACAGKTFFAGADIKEFGKPPVMPSLREVHDAMDDCPKPIVAALHGTVLGGGLETALACHARIALKGTRFGLPEVKLGLLPGAGGTQRLPRLIGAEGALELILSGNQIDDDEALRLGIIDHTINDADLIDSAVALAIQKSGAKLVRVKDMTNGLAKFPSELFEARRTKLKKTARGLIAPQRIVDAVEAALTLPFEAGLEIERQSLVECLASPQREAQVHLFFAERAAAKLPKEYSATPRPLRHAAIIGSGTMGSGIAMCCANAGLQVDLIDLSEDALARGRGSIAQNYATSVKRGSATTAEVDLAMSRIRYGTELSASADADIVIEAVFEDLDVKRQIMAQIDAIARPGAILATNTSTLDIDELAAATNRPQDVIGTHFFSPANVMRLLEIVRGTRSSADAITTGMAFGRLLGKVTVLAGNCDGFIVNRMQAPFGNQVDRLIEQGASPELIDGVLKDFGFAMGPLAVRDLVGIDTGWRIRDQRRRLHPGKQPPTPLMDRLYALGRLGQKSGKGYYRYEGRTPLPDTEVDTIIEEIAQASGVARTQVSEEEVRERTLYALINEAAKILDEGISLRASDIDVAYVNGYGFPAWRGGPMHWGQTIGFDKIYRKILSFREEFGEAWEPAEWLARAARTGDWETS